MASIELGYDTRPQAKRIGRGLVVAAGAMGLAGLAAAGIDGLAGYRKWPETNTELVGIGAETTHATLTFSGLGSLGGAEQSEQVRRLIPGPAAHWKYSTSRFSVAELARLLGAEAPLLEYANLNGHSMGGPVGLEVARMRGIKLGHVLLHCSPYSIEDTNFARASTLMELCRWPVGPGAKFVFSYLRGVLESLPAEDRLRRAIFDSTNGCSPRIWPHKLRALRRIDLTAHMADYQALVGPETRVDYFMPEDEDLDTTVLTRQASGRYRAFFGKLGVPYREHKVPGAGHADVQKAVEYYLANVPGQAG